MLTQGEIKKAIRGLKRALCEARGSRLFREVKIGDLRLAPSSTKAVRIYYVAVEDKDAAWELGEVAGRKADHLRVLVRVRIEAALL